MSDLMKAIHDDIEQYVFLCARYGEEVQYDDDAYGHPLPDCYGEHADNLKKQHRKEMQNGR